MSDKVDATIEVQMVPHGKGRPRARVIKGRAIIYTPERTERWEQQFAAQASIQLRGVPRMEGPVAVEVLAIVPRPQRLERRKDPAGEVWSTAKPDTDNVIKSVLDALSFCWRDDSQVVRVLTEKAYAAKGQPARIYVRIYEPGVTDRGARLMLWHLPAQARQDAKKEEAGRESDQ